MKCIALDLQIKLHEIINNFKILTANDQEAQLFFNKFKVLSKIWDDCAQEFVNLARDILRKHSEKFVPVKIEKFPMQVQNQVNYLESFRQSHFSFIKSLKKMSSIHYDELEGAYKKLSELKDFHGEWDQHEESYNSILTEIEDQVISQLRQDFEKSSNSSEMLKIFSMCQSLFQRPRIRSSLFIFQSQILKKVNNDIKLLYDVYMKGYEQSDEFLHGAMTKGVYGSILWRRKLKYKLDIIMGQIHSVFGDQWRSQSEAQALANQISLFETGLGETPLISLFIENSNPEANNSSVFDIKYDNDKPILHVNFDEAKFDFCDQVNGLTSLEILIPHKLITAAKEIYRIRPFYIVLKELVNRYNVCMRTLYSSAELQSYLQNSIAAVHATLKNGSVLKWNMFYVAFDFRNDKDAPDKISVFMKRFSNDIEKLVLNTERLSIIKAQLSELLLEIKQAIYQEPSLKAIKCKIQNFRNEIQSLDLSNCDSLLSEIDEQVNQCLASKCSKVIDSIALYVKSDFRQRISNFGEIKVINSNK